MDALARAGDEDGKALARELARDGDADAVPGAGAGDEGGGEDGHRIGLPGS